MRWSVKWRVSASFLEVSIAVLIEFFVTPHTLSLLIGQNGKSGRLIITIVYLLTDRF